MREYIHTKLAVVGILAEELLDSHKNNDFFTSTKMFSHQVYTMISL